MSPQKPLVQEHSKNKQQPHFPFAPVKSEEERRKEIEVKTHDTFHQEVFNEFQKIADTIPKFNITFRAPYLIKKYYGNKQYVNYSQDWDWINEYEELLAVEAKTNPEFIADYNSILDNVVQLAIQNRLTPDIMKQKASLIAIKMIESYWILSKTK